MLVEWLEGTHKGSNKRRAPWESSVVPNFAHLTGKCKHVENPKRRVPETNVEYKIDCLLLSGVEAVRFLVQDDRQTSEGAPQYWIPTAHELVPWDEHYTAREDNCSDLVRMYSYLWWCMNFYGNLSLLMQINVKFYADFELKWEVRYENAKRDEQDTDEPSAQESSEPESESSDSSDETSDEDQEDGDEVRVCDLANSAAVPRDDKVTEALDFLFDD